MKKISSILFLSLSLISLYPKGVKPQEIFKNNISTKNINANKKQNLNLSTNSTNENNVQVLLTGIGQEAVLNKEISNKLITLNIKTQNTKNKPSFQSLSIPSVGIKTLTLNNSEEDIKILITPIDQVTLSEPEILLSSNELKMIFPKRSLPNDLLTEENIFSAKPLNTSSEEIMPKLNATAPPLGDISIGTTYIPNLKTVQLEGPDLSIVFKGTTAKSAIEFLISKTNYGYVWVQNNPTFNTQENNQENIVDLNEQFSAEDSGEDNASDSARYITMTVKDKPFSVVFNSILMSSGLEAKLENGIVYIGPDVQDRIFSSRISRIYRLNQTTASAAASYLANLGAVVRKTNTITTAVTSGASQSESVSGAASSATTTEQSTTSVTSYGGNEGPLLGLIATTDDRLQTLTLIGTPDLIDVAETYIKQLDLRQRQVALSVKILDVEISDGLNLENNWAFRQGNKFIVNASGQLLSSINDINPPGASGFPSAPTANPSNQYPDKVFINQLKSDILSKDTKIIANPTLILNEYPGSTGGETVALSSIEDTLKAGTIGRSFGNEAFVIVGSQVPINCEVDTETGAATLEMGIAGLTFGARILKIDDNGYVTFTLSPAISSTAEQRNIEGCGAVDLLNTRRLDTGSIRVKDGNTLILTGVIDTNEVETIRKFPILGDLPILGSFFRQTTTSKNQRELIILVTPQILNSFENNQSEIGFNKSN